jgi:outer membrane biosynthesis protein TonB
MLERSRAVNVARWAPKQRMSIRITPVEGNEPTGERSGSAGPDFDSGRKTAVAEEIPAEAGNGSSGNGTGTNGVGTNGSGGREPAMRGSRWIDYDTHELLEMIGHLEDERRWARLREGVLWAILIHILLLFALFLIPRYVLKMQPVIVTPNNKEFTYLDSPFVPRPKPVRPLTHQPLIDQKTLEELKRQATPAPAPPPPPQQQAPAVQQPQPTQPIPPSPQSQSQVEAPRPAAVPARPNFAMESQNPADQLKHDMQNAMRNRGSDQGQVPMGGGLPRHPGAGGGAQIISDTQGVDFNAWLAAWHYETERTWDPLIPEEVNPPINKQGQVMIRFKVLPNGRLMDGSVVLEGRSGDVALDRAAWGALTGSSYPPLPKDFHGPYIELRAWFLYNMQPPNQ